MYDLKTKTHQELQKFSFFAATEIFHEKPTMSLRRQKVRTVRAVTMGYHRTYDHHKPFIYLLLPICHFFVHIVTISHNFPAHFLPTREKFIQTNLRNYYGAATKKKAVVRHSAL